MWGQRGKLTMIVSKINESSVFQSSRLFVLCNPEFPWKIPEQTKVWHKWYVHVSLSYLSKLKSPLLSLRESGVCCWVILEVTVVCECLLTWQNTVKIKREEWDTDDTWGFLCETQHLWNDLLNLMKVNEDLDKRASWMNQRQRSVWLVCVIAHVRNRLKFNPLFTEDNQAVHHFTTLAIWCTSHSTEERNSYGLEQSKWWENINLSLI